MANARKILVVDDDAELRNTLIEQLALQEEFETDAVDTAQAALAHAKSGHIDLVLMDVGLPDMDGRGRWVLRKTAKAPVIMLTGERTPCSAGAGGRGQRLRVSRSVSPCSWRASARS
jgi:DNA-binding response OmpR family regulator